MKRWKVQIIYISGDTRVHEIEEISDLHDLVEAGPDFYLLKEIKFEVIPQ